MQIAGMTEKEAKDKGIAESVYFQRYLQERCRAKEVAAGT